MSDPDPPNHEIGRQLDAMMGKRKMGGPDPKPVEPAPPEPAFPIAGTRDGWGGFKP
jgi:hypothetical protein